MMGDYGGYSAVLDITEQENIRPDARLEYDYLVHICGFFTTNDMLTKFVVFLFWFPLSLFQVYRLYSQQSKIKQE